MAKSKVKQTNDDQFPFETINYMFKGLPTSAQIKLRVPYGDFIAAVRGCVEAIMEHGYDAASGEYAYNAQLITLFTDITDVTPDYILDLVYDSTLLEELGNKSKQACVFYQAVQSQLEYAKSRTGSDIFFETLTGKLDKIDADKFQGVIEMLSKLNIDKVDQQQVVKMVVETLKPKRKPGRPKSKPLTVSSQSNDNTK